jgi:hypothetical protein
MLIHSAGCLVQGWCLRRKQNPRKHWIGKREKKLFSLLDSFIKPKDQSIKGWIKPQRRQTGGDFSIRCGKEAKGEDEFIMVAARKSSLWVRKFKLSFIQTFVMRLQQHWKDYYPSVLLLLSQLMASTSQKWVFDFKRINAVFRSSKNKYFVFRHEKNLQKRFLVFFNEVGNQDYNR